MWISIVFFCFEFFAVVHFILFGFFAANGGAEQKKEQSDVRRKETTDLWRYDVTFDYRNGASKIE